MIFQWTALSFVRSLRNPLVNEPGVYATTLFPYKSTHCPSSTSYLAYPFYIVSQNEAQEAPSKHQQTVFNCEGLSWFLAGQN